MKRLQKLFAILHQWKPYYIMAALLLIVSTFARVLEPKVLQLAIDGVITYFKNPEAGTPTANDGVAQWLYTILPNLSVASLWSVLIAVGLLYLGIALVRGLSMFVSSALAAFATEKAIKRLRDNLFAHIQRLPLGFHSKLKTGETIQRCTGDVDTIREFINTQVVELILMSSIFVMAFYMMSIVHLTYALIAIALVPAIVITSWLFFRYEQKVWKAHEEEQDKLTAMAEENLSGIRVVQAFAKEDFEIQKFDDQNQQATKAGIRHVDLHALFWPVSDTLIHLQIAISIFAGGYFTLMHQITVGELASFYTYAIMVTWPMRRLGRIVSKMGMAFVAIDRLSAILDEETEDYTGLEEEKALKGTIEFKNVSFVYANDKEKKEVLRNVSFKVKAGEKVAFLGPTASGKSTIIQLLTRFYEPTKGEILLDGIPLQQYSKSFVRKRIGVVLQKAFLFSTSIKQNIAYTNPNIADEEVIQAAKAASIHEILDVFADGYETVVGEKGVTLSGGQKQRVALARTLLEKPDILVLDDTTSAVDTETEYQIQQALKEHMANKTTFVIAHRISALQDADQIIVLDKGEVVERGTHESLMKREGFYRKVYELQTAVEV